MAVRWWAGEEGAGKLPFPWCPLHTLRLGLRATPALWLAGEGGDGCAVVGRGERGRQAPPPLAPAPHAAPSAAGDPLWLAGDPAHGARSGPPPSPHLGQLPGRPSLNPTHPTHTHTTQHTKGQVTWTGGAAGRGGGGGGGAVTDLQSNKWGSGWVCKGVRVAGSGGTGDRRGGGAPAPKPSGAHVTS